MAGIKVKKEPPAWFKRNHYPLSKLKKFTLLHWWEQLSVRAFVRENPVEPVAGALWLSDMAYREFRRVLETLDSGQIKNAGLSKSLPKELLSLFSVIVKAVQFLLKCEAVDQLTFYQSDFIITHTSGSSIEADFEKFLINESTREVAEADFAQPSEPQIIEDAPLHPLQEKIIGLIEQNGIVVIDGLFDYGEWVYSFPCHWISRNISRIKKLSPPIRPISSTELQGLAEYCDSNPDGALPTITRNNRIFLSVPINLSDAFLKASFAACLETLRDSYEAEQLDRRETTWAECALLQCLDLHDWNGRNNDRLTIQNIIDFAFEKPLQDRTMYNKTTLKWMKEVLQPDFLANLLETAISEKK